MRHQELHLVRQNPAVAQNKVFPQAGNIRRVKQRHVGLLWRATTFAVVAGSAGRDDVHPSVDPLLRKWHDVLPRQILFIKMLAAVGANVAVARKQFEVGQPWLEVKRVDLWQAFGANDAVDMNDRLLARDGVVPTMEGRHLRTCLPTHLVRGVMQHSFFQTDPGLRQTLR